MTKPIDTLRFRELRWQDVAAVTVIEAELFGSDAWSAETFWSELARVPETRRYLVADVAGQIVGYAGLSWTMGAVAQADLQTVAVAGAAQSRGVGRGIVRLLLTGAVERGCVSCLLEVRADNEVAIAMYESLGFDHLARRDRYYTDGTAALIMRAPLTSARHPMTTAVSNDG